MSLRGSLETVGLPDVLTLLATTAKTGELQVTGANSEGRLWVKEGRLVGSDAGRSDSYLDAIFELLRVGTGTFSFDDGGQPSLPGDPTDIEPLLTEAAERLTQWQAIEAVVPSLLSVVCMLPEAPEPEVMVRADQWRLLAATGGGLAVQDVLDAVHLGEFDGCKALKELVEAKLIGIEEPAPVVVAPLPEVEPPAVEVVVAHPAIDPIVDIDSIVVGEPDDAPVSVRASSLDDDGIDLSPVGASEDHHGQDHNGSSPSWTVHDDGLEQAAERAVPADDTESAVAWTTERAEPAGQDEAPVWTTGPAAEDESPVWTAEPTGQDEPLVWTPEPTGQVESPVPTAEAAAQDPSPVWTTDPVGHDESPVWNDSSGPVEVEIPAALVPDATEQPMDPTGYRPLPLPAHSVRQAPTSDDPPESGEAAANGDPALVAEETVAADEPINRGLLLKFLSSVRT